MKLIDLSVCRSKFILLPVAVLPLQCDGNLIFVFQFPSVCVPNNSVLSCLLGLRCVVHERTLFARVSMYVSRWKRAWAAGWVGTQASGASHATLVGPNEVSGPDVQIHCKRSVT